MENRRDIAERSLAQIAQLSGSKGSRCRAEGRPYNCRKNDSGIHSLLNRVFRST